MKCICADGVILARDDIILERKWQAGRAFSVFLIKRIDNSLNRFILNGTLWGGILSYLNYIYDGKWI